jgi:hypothetical protein
MQTYIERGTIMSTWYQVLEYSEYDVLECRSNTLYCTVQWGVHTSVQGLQPVQMNCRVLSKCTWYLYQHTTVEYMRCTHNSRSLSCVFHSCHNTMYMYYLYRSSQRLPFTLAITPTPRVTLLVRLEADCERANYSDLRSRYIFPCNRLLLI